MILRTLGTFERALFLSDQHAPFNVVSMLQLDFPPASGTIRRALEILQQRHPLLQSIIQDGKFKVIPNPSFSLEVIEQPGFNWINIVEREMNTRLHPESGLFRSIYLSNKVNHADVFLTVHHAIMDAVSGMNLLDELLQICVAIQAGEEPDSSAMPVPPPVEERFPPPYKGLRGALKMVRYGLAQMAEEIQYQARTRGLPKQPVRLGGRGFPLILVLPEPLVDVLSHRCRTEKVTLNSLLNASLLLAANRHLYQGGLRLMQTFTFADLRPYTTPPTPVEHLANFISMMRFTVDVSGKKLIWELTKKLHEKIYRALKRGDKFLASKMSESLIKTFVRLKSMRMGITALNYSSAVPLGTRYGGIKVGGLHAFLSSFDLGPRVSSQARLFNNELWMDFMFLDTDMDRKTAQEIVDEVKLILEEAATGSA